LQAVIEQEKKNILPEANLLLPIMDIERTDKEELPAEYEFNENNYNDLDMKSKMSLINVELNWTEIAEEFEKVA
jgi:hypothetical protein